MNWGGVWKKKHFCCKVSKRSMSSSVAKATCSRRSSGEVVVSGGGGGCCGAARVGALAVGVLELVVSVLGVDEVVETPLSVGDDGGLLVRAGLASVAWGAGWRCDGVASCPVICAGFASVAWGRGWLCGGAAGLVCWRQRSAILAAWEACRSPRKFWRRASCAVAGR